MYACLHACIHACTMHACKHVCMQSCMHAIVRACNRACMYEHACMSMNTHAEKHATHSMHHACTCGKIPDKLGGESHRFHVHASTSTSKIPGCSCRKENHARNYTNACYFEVMKLRKSYYACGSMLACPTMPCHGARMSLTFLRNASEGTFTMLNTTTINVSRKIITNINAFKCKSKTCVYDMNFDPKLFKSFELRLRGRSGAS